MRAGIGISFSPFIKVERDKLCSFLFHWHAINRLNFWTSKFAIFYFVINFVRRAFILYLIFSKIRKILPYFEQNLAQRSERVSILRTMRRTLHTSLTVKKRNQGINHVLRDFSHGSAGPTMCERGCWVDELLAAAFDGEVQRLRGTLNAKLAIVSARDKSARAPRLFSRTFVSDIVVWK